MTTAWFTFVCSRGTTRLAACVGGRFQWLTTRVRSGLSTGTIRRTQRVARRVEGLDGCHTYGRTKPEAADRIQEALAACLDKHPSEFTLSHA